MAERTPPGDRSAIRAALQDCHGPILGYLVRACGSFDDAEDLCQDVMLGALAAWQAGPMPANPRAWLYRAARNRLIDRYRHARVRGHEPLTDDLPGDDDTPGGFLDDDLLRLIFTCCHPALAPEARVPLTLKSVTGLSTAEVARAFLVNSRPFGPANDICSSIFSTISGPLSHVIYWRAQVIRSTPNSTANPLTRILDITTLIGISL